MKKFIFLVLIFALLLSACSGSFSKDSVSPLPEPTQSAAPTPVPTPEPTPEPTLRPILEPFTVNSQLDLSYFDIPEEKGTLETVSYTTYDYTSSGDEMQKNMCVYLPYGYDDSKEYNVLFLMHTLGANERFWFAEHQYRLDDGTSKSLYIPYLIDNMIEKGNCAPLIVVSLSGYISEEAASEHNSSRDFEQFSSEFRYDILPYIEQNYSVGSGREHVGFMGASFGAYLTYRSILGPCFDICASFGLTGGGTVEPWWLEEKWADCNASDMRASYVYIGEGDADDRGPVELGYMYLAARQDIFDDSNLSFTLFENTSHEFREWDNTLFNCLQLFFREGNTQ